MHAPRGCSRRGIRNEEQLATEFGEWLQEWRLGATERTEISRYLARPRSEDDATRGRREQLLAERDRLRKLYQWGDLADDEYARERTRIARALAAVAPTAKETPPSPDALRLAAEIGTAWSLVGPDTRRRFVDEWVRELRIHPDGHVDVVPRDPYRLIVAAAVGGPSTAEGGHSGQRWARTSDLLRVKETL
jgi:hypothetical protein